ncbi:MAG: cation:proton antiporter [Bacteroides sp.]|nr:cation:proton antiporter [Bacillota bacterium]MCM1394198.1 cation:proton antiporter [[Eubacterium] siraeum]MCM1455746.1 cation:proton antiporter [Bacteroides sp.]
MFSNDLLSAGSSEAFELLLPLALILLLSKFFSLVGKKLGLPQVVGMLVAGILLGLIKLIPNQNVLTDDTLQGLSFLAKIGVILIMFSAGIETDFKQFKSCGVPSVLITILGVAVPMVFGFLVATAFNGGFAHVSENAFHNLFYGAILSATSVSVTVATLKELGKLNSKVGTSIITAAILDDIIGVILLSLFISLDHGTGAKEVGIVIGKMIGFFAAAGAIGVALHFAINYIQKKRPHTRRIPILGFAVCFFFAYAAEEWFGIADITGAYVAGLIFATVHDREYINRKIEISNYMIFAPVFFANIGITADFSGITATMAGFGVCFILAGLLGKVIGCGAGSLICKYSVKDSLRVGIGMMVRAEVVIVCTQKGIDNGMINPAIMPFVILLVVISALLAPLFLKLLYKNDKTPLMPPPSDSNILPEATAQSSLENDMSTAEYSREA